MEYVLGFQTDDQRTHVVLVNKKTGPKLVAGKLNGCGGKLQPGETSQQAMDREAREELGSAECGGVWKYRFSFGEYDDGGTHSEEWRVHVFVKVTRERPGLMEFKANAANAEGLEEPLGIYDVRELPSPSKMAPSLSWVIPLALDPGEPRVEIDGIFYRG